MIDESIKKLLFEKNFNGDYRSFFLAIIDELESLNCHIGKATSNSMLAIDNDSIIFKKFENTDRSIQDLVIRDSQIAKISNSSLKISVLALFLILIIGWQTSPVTMDKIGEVASWIIKKL